MTNDLTAAPADPTSRSLTQAVDSRLESFAERVAGQERERRLSERSFEEMRECGFFRAFVPSRFGGDERPVGDLLQAVRRLAAVDASTAWVIGLLAAHQHVVAYFDRRAQEEVWADGPDTIVTTSGEPVGRTEPVEGGMRLSGRWRFSSGSDYAKWVMVGFRPADAGSGDPRRSWALVGPGDFAVEDTWFTYGLRGSGSKDLVIEDVFVPEYRVVNQASSGASPELHANGLYRLPFMAIFSAPFAAVMLGAGEGALAIQREKLRSRVRNFSGVRGVTPVAQERLGESALELRAAAALVERHWKELEWHAQEDVAVSDERYGLWRQDDCYAGEMVSRAVERLVKNAGGSVVYESGALQRFWRDVHAMRGHSWFDFDNVVQQHGRLQLGLEPDPSLGV